jgi:hypothetical protein
MAKETINIGYEHRAQRYLMIEFRLFRGFVYPVGELRWFEKSIFENRCVALIEEAFRTFGPSETVPTSELNSMRPEKRRKLFRDLAFVWLGLTDERSLLIHPLRYERGLLRAAPNEDQVITDWPTTPDILVGMLQKLWA